MQKFLLTWFKKKSVGEKKLFTSFFLRDLGRNDGTIPSRGQNKRGAGLLSHDVTKDAAPCPSPAWLPGSLGRTRERVDGGLVAPGPRVTGGFPPAGTEQHCPVGVTCHAGARGA